MQSSCSDRSLLIIAIFYRPSIEEIVATGPAYGCQTADIFGCLYFYLSEQFRKFTGRLREFKIQFKFVDKDSHVIADYLKGGIFSKIGLTENTVFDRIDMSNLADNEKTGGIAGVLKDWAPFVNKKNRNATLFGHSTGWVTQQRKGQPGPTEMQALTLQLLSKGKVSLDQRFDKFRFRTDFGKQLDAKKMQPDLIPAWFKYYVALYDNSAAFEEWLTKQGVDEAAKKAGLKRKKKHTIVPHVRKLGPLLSPSLTYAPLLPYSVLEVDSATCPTPCLISLLTTAGIGM